jgi:phosphopantothenate-cysteine ligase
MNILITAGGTTERIDEVRAITNTGTGTLGATIADRFAEADSANEITYVCSKNAVRPTAKADIFIADDAASLEYTIREICTSQKIDVVIHSMAVSDYRTRTVTDSALLAARISAEALDAKLPESEISDIILNPPPVPDRGKIRSNHEDLVLILEKTPKIIGMFRGLLPEAILVGFKLLSGAPLNELIDEGRKTLEVNDCDFVLANDMTTVAIGKHTGYLISRDGSYTPAEGKDAIADLIVSSVLVLR